MNRQYQTMEADSSTPLFTSGQSIATFLVSSGLVTKAWEESRLANNSESYNLNEYEGVAYVSFPSFHKIEGFIVQGSKYGEGNIQTDNKVFSASLKSNDEQPALVHQGALKLFLHIMENTDFQAKNDHARLALQVAGNMENKYTTNVAKLAIELSEKQCIMAELEWYKERCEKEDRSTYYDSFKKQNRKDIDANFRRVKLAGFWDDIIAMWKSNELPSDFQSQNKWINAGTAYRRLVEPLDIAHYYRMCKGECNYFLDGRSASHKVLQKWMEEKEKTRRSRGQKVRTKLASLTQDSCFWAHVEEALKDLEILKQQHQNLESLEMFENLESLEMFEGYVTKMFNGGNISADVFMEGSSFMEWWNEWKEYKQNQFPGWSSPLYEIMANESWKR